MSYGSSSRIEIRCVEELNEPIDNVRLIFSEVNFSGNRFLESLRMNAVLNIPEQPERNPGKKGSNTLNWPSMAAARGFDLVQITER